MKRLFSPPLIALSLVAVVMVSYVTAADLPTRTVKVSARAAVEVVPNQVLLVLQLRTEDKSLLVAKAENERRVKAVLTVAKKHQLSDTQIEVSPPLLGPCASKTMLFGSVKSSVASGSGWTDRSGYVVLRGVRITLKDFALLEPVLAHALQAGATEVSQILFQSTKYREHSAETRQRAFSYAKEKATQLAESNGLKLGKAIQIEEGFPYFDGSQEEVPLSASPDPGETMPTAASINRNDGLKNGGREQPLGISSGLPPGVLTISTSVTISFQMLDAR